MIPGVVAPRAPQKQAAGEAATPPAPDAVPDHYRLPGVGSVRDVTSSVLDRDAGVWRPSVEAVRADAIEYLMRAPKKGGAEDLRKARRCIEEMLAMMGQPAEPSPTLAADVMRFVVEDVHRVFGYDSEHTYKERAHEYLTENLVSRTGSDTAVERCVLHLVERAGMSV